MNSPGAQPSPHLPVLIFWGGLLVYVLGFMAWYSLTPLGLVPGADDREILALARQIASVTLPHEAFYRAPGYPALLALGLWLGVPDSSLIILARLLNTACHLASTALVFGLANRLWGTRRAAWLAAGLVGFNPVLLHFAADALDVSVAMTLMLLGLAATFRSASGRPGYAVAALAFCAAALCRPQLLPLLALPFLQAVRRPGAPRRLLSASLTVLLVVFAMGGVNQRLAGDFRILPWQGAFNLWAANHPGANGRYFTQTLAIESYDAGANTARLEAEALYHRDVTTAGAGEDYRTMTHYWQDRALVAITGDPLAWARLMGQKLRYLLNNEEQYNNKTYAFHKARSPWLASNPICWAVIWPLAVAGAIAGWRRASVRWVVLAVGIGAASVMLFYVSDRFRAPLVPLLALLAGGAWEIRGSGKALPAALAAAAALVVAVWPPGYPTTETVVQDRMMLASSATTVGLHVEALAEIHAASEDGDARPGLVALRCVVEFNAWLAETTTDELPWARDCRRAASTSRTARLQAAHADWRDGLDARAIEAWQALAATDGPTQDTALAALLYAGVLTPTERTKLDAAAARHSAVVLAALAVQRKIGAWKRLVMVVGEGQAARDVAALERLWSAPRENPGAPRGR